MNVEARYVLGTGHALPERVVPSEAVDARLGKPAGWVERRTGIRTRRIEAEYVGVSRLAARAGRDALEAAELDAGDVGLVILATSTPDYPLPPTAPAVAAKLGVAGGAFDVAGACAGFVQALVMADSLLAARRGIRGALVIGANVLSSRLDWDDADTAALFADGAGAVALRCVDGGHGAAVGSRLLGAHLASAGEYAAAIRVPAGGSRCPATEAACERGDTHMRMHDGALVFREAVRLMHDAAQRALEEAGLTTADVDWFVPHQANARMCRRLAARLGVAPARVVSNVRDVGNTSAASIPIALDEAARDGRIRPGHRVLLTAAGAGLTAAAAVLAW